MSIIRTVPGTELEPGMRVYDRDSGRILHVDRVTPVPDIDDHIIVFRVYELTSVATDRSYEILEDEQ